MKALSRPNGLILLGGGGHGRVLLAALVAEGRHKEVIGIIDPMAALMAKKIASVPVLGSDEALIFQYSSSEVVLINGLGSTASTQRRRQLYESFCWDGYGFTGIRHPSALLAGEVEYGDGCQFMAGATLQTGSKLAENVIINTGAVVDHDCRIGAHVHIAPGAVVSGGVEVGMAAHIGCGATIIQGVKIGKEAVVGAGAVVIRDVPDGVTVVGCPAALIAE
jgi:sugar O-acyltransferase (sialic acid O-acetyltransferase NeuD family)